MQRKTPLQIPLGPRDFGAVQAATDANLDSLCAETQSRINRLSHRSAERNALFQLHGNRFGDELRIELRSVDFLNVDIDLAIRPLLNVGFQLVDFSSLATDDEAWTRRVDRYAELVGHPFNFDVAYTGMAELLLEVPLQLEIFVKQTAVVALGEPSRAPRLRDTEAKPI